MMLVAFSKRIAQRRQSEAALDHLERGTRRDYTAPSEGDEAEELPVVYRDDGEDQGGLEAESLLALQDEEMPHMKYVRGEHATENEPSSSDDNEDDLPKAEEAYHELTEEEAAILSGGTGHYRLARTQSSKPEDDEQPASASIPSHTARNRRASRTGSAEKNLNA